jgi:tetratricopeptide (TPR) repeat protein
VLASKQPAIQATSFQAVDPERIADAEDEGGRVSIETETKVDVDLLCRRDAVEAARIEEEAGRPVIGVIADILQEYVGAAADRFLDHERGFRGEVIDRVGGKEERGDHAADAPAAHLARPGQLQRATRAPADRAARPAIAEFRKTIALSGDNATFTSNLAHAFAVSGRTEEAMKLLTELKDRHTGQSPTDASVALIYVGLGDNDQAMAWLERAYQARFNPSILLRPAFDPLRADLRFRDLRARIGLPAN